MIVFLPIERALLSGRQESGQQLQLVGCGNVQRLGNTCLIHLQVFEPAAIVVVAASVVMVLFVMVYGFA